MRQKFGENAKNHFAKIKFGENIIIVFELQKVWQIKVNDLVKITPNFVLYSMYLRIIGTKF